MHAFMQKLMGDFAATVSVACGHIGDKLGLYKAMADGNPVTSAQLAERTGCSERYIREWLINQAAGGYIEYDAAARTYRMSPEHSVVLAQEGSPYMMGGGFEVYMALLRSEHKIVECFKTGGGLSWGEHDAEVFSGTERLFRPAYEGNLVSSWIPAIDGMEDRLKKGAKVADVGCGHGVSTLIMAREFPNSQFVGFDNHEPSIKRAREEAQAAGLSDRVKFEVADSASYPGNDYDLICFFDCLHDMGHPDAACKHAFNAVKPDGALMIVEPMAGRTVEENFNPIGQAFAGASVLCCTPNAIASGGAASALGTIATDEALEKVVKSGGFTKFARVVETAFNRIFEARR